MNKEKIQNRIKEVIKNFKNVEFKTEGLGALEFEKEVFTKSFKVENIKFRIERVAMQVANKILEKEDIDYEEINKTLKTFIAYPVEARNTDYFELDYNAMSEIIELIGEFQSNPFFFTKGARSSEENTTV